MVKGEASSESYNMAWARTAHCFNLNKRFKQPIRAGGGKQEEAQGREIEKRKEK